MDIYHRLRKHFDMMPVAFPETASGIEIDILRRFFTEEEAEVALQMSMLPERAERIHRRVAKSARNGAAELSLERVRTVLDTLDEKRVINSSIVRRRKGPAKVYGKLP